MQNLATAVAVAAILAVPALAVGVDIGTSGGAQVGVGVGGAQVNTGVRSDTNAKVNDTDSINNTDSVDTSTESGTSMDSDTESEATINTGRGFSDVNRRTGTSRTNTVNRSHIDPGL